MEFLIISKCPPALGHFKIIPTMLNTYSIRRSGLPNKCIAPALPAASVRRTPWVLGPSVPAESCGPARQSSQDTASTALLGSGGGQPAGTAASPSIPGFVLGCLTASRHPVRELSCHPHRPNQHHQPQAHALHDTDINRPAQIIQPSDVLRLRYGGGTFEIKSCRM